MRYRSALALLGLVVSLPAATQAGGDWQDNVTVTVLEADGTHMLIQVEVATDPVWPFGGRATYAFIVPEGATLSYVVTDSLTVDLSPTEESVETSTAGETRDTTTTGAAAITDFVKFYDPFVQRNFNAATMDFVVATWNSGTQKAHVYTSMTVQVTFSGESSIQMPSVVVEEWHRMYSCRFINYDLLAAATPPSTVAGQLLIVSHGPFVSELSQLVEWKKRMGLSVTVVSTATIGSDSTSVGDFIEDFYSTNPDLCWVLLVGDHAQIESLWFTPDPPSYVGFSDNRYACFLGDDLYPDILIGRMSAESVSDVSTQVARTLAYERAEGAGAWLRKWTVFASTEVYASQFDPISDTLEFYGSELSEALYTMYSDLNPDFEAAVNNGRGFVHNAGEGDHWGFKWPYWTCPSCLNNAGKLPIVFSGSCNTGSFASHPDPALAEKFLRAKDTQGRPIGAVAVLMACQYVGGLPHMLLTRYTIENALNSFGGICFAATSQTTDDRTSTSPESTEAFRAWTFAVQTVFGDPSLAVRTAEPEVLTVTHDPINPLTATEFDVTVTDVEGALCALYADGTLFGSAYTDAQGSATIPITGTLPTDHGVILTVTGFNKVPHIDTLFYDTDGDGILQYLDNCPSVANTNQADGDSDCAGDVCDNCPLMANTNQSDQDSDSLGDVCDNCPTAANLDQANNDLDSLGDVCDPDDDNDGVADAEDNCQFTSNLNQADSTSDCVGDVCDCCFGMTGNVNCDPYDNVTIADVSYLVDHLMGPGYPPLCCLEESDVNGSGGDHPTEADITISDVSTLVDYLFISGTPLVDCYDCTP